MKKEKLISILVMGIFTLSLFVPAVSAATNIESNTSVPEPKLSSEQDIVAQNIEGNIEDSLVQLRKDKADFINKKNQEDAERAASLQEKVLSKRKAAEARAEAARKIKDEKRKIVLNRLIDIQIKQLENTKKRVLKMPNIKEDAKTTINAKIDEAVLELGAEKIILEKITTTEDLKVFAKELKDLFKTKRDIVRVIVDEILFSRANKSIAAAEARLAEIKAKIAELKADGQDTSVLDGLVIAVESKISDAAKKADKGSDIKGAISDLKEAYKSMKSALEKTETDNAE